jgi:tetratricopeptide (TPR) repeat protein
VGRAPEVEAATKEHRLGAEALESGNYLDASKHFERAARLFQGSERAGDAAGEFLYAGFANESVGDLSAALALYEKALALQRPTGDPLELFAVLRRIAGAAAALGEDARRESALEEARHLSASFTEDAKQELVQEGLWDVLQPAELPEAKRGGPTLRLLSTGAGTDFAVLQRLVKALPDRSSWRNLSVTSRMSPDPVGPYEEVAAGDTIVYQVASGSKSLLLDQVAEIRSLEAVGAIVVPVIPVEMGIPDELREFAPISGDFENAFDAIVERLSAMPRITFSRLSPIDFEALVADVLRSYEFSDVVLHPDRYTDISAHYSTLEPFGVPFRQRWLVEVRLYRSNRSRADLKSLRAFAQRLEQQPSATVGLFVTNGQLTSVAHEWVRDYEGHRHLRVLEGPDLRRLISGKPALVRRYFAGASRE